MAILEETGNVDRSRPSESPPDFGYTLFLDADDPSLLLRGFRDVWRVVAQWGRFVDEQMGEWPSEDECLASLPGDFRAVLRRDWSVDLEGWLDDVHDRDWIVWSVAVVDGLLKVDINANSMPISTWPARLVAEALGARVVYADIWRASPPPRSQG